MGNGVAILPWDIFCNSGGEYTNACGSEGSCAHSVNGLLYDFIIWNARLSVSWFSQKLASIYIQMYIF